MSVSKVKILPSALVDIEATAHFLANNRPDLVLRFFHAVSSTAAEISEFPHAAPHWRPLKHRPKASIRFRSVLGFPKILIFYTQESSQISIRRILHSSRDIATELNARFSS